MTSSPATRIRLDDIEAKLRQMGGHIGDEADAAKPALATGAVFAGAVVVVAVYLLGRRRGRKRSTVVEIRRI